MLPEDCTDDVVFELMMMKWKMGGMGVVLG